MKKRWGKKSEVKAGEWVYPVSHNYLMCCCDCGLVHRMNFGVFRRKDHKRLDYRSHRVGLQCWRENRVTAAMRRKRKTK